MTYSLTLYPVRGGSPIEYTNVVFDDVIRFNVEIGPEGRVANIGSQVEYRYIILENRERIEYPMKEYLVNWGKERQQIIDEAQMKKQAPAEESI